MKINHVGLIPDGTRRWARKNNLDYLTAYTTSMDKIADFIRYCINRKIKIISTYMLSSDNLKREKKDLNPLMAAELYFLKYLLPDLCVKQSCNVVIAGNMDILPSNITEAIAAIPQVNNHHKTTLLNFLFAYDPVNEIEASLIKGNGLFNMENLFVSVPVDLIIRTAGGPCLLSNFLPIQCGYAQIYMLEKLFNDCTHTDFENTIKKAETVNMPFGK